VILGSWNFIFHYSFSLVASDAVEQAQEMLEMSWIQLATFKVALSQVAFCRTTLMMFKI